VTHLDVGTVDRHPLGPVETGDEAQVHPAPVEVGPPGPIDSTFSRVSDRRAEKKGECHHPLGWCYHDAQMQFRSTVVPEVKPRVIETEKITINLGLIDLGQIDLLVQEGFYSNRTDLIRTAIRNQLAAHANVLRQTVARRTLVLGLQEFSKHDLEALRKSRKKLRIQVLGLVRIADDVSPALARDTIESISVLGALHASAAVKAALAGRTR
jgi:Arc/MetJ-type ribon-helix-helix transcriptional regulator